MIPEKIHSVKYKFCPEDWPASFTGELTLHAAAVLPACLAFARLLAPSTKWSNRNVVNTTDAERWRKRAAVAVKTQLQAMTAEKGWVRFTIIIFSNMTAVCPAASLSSLLSLLFSSCRARFLSSSCVTFSADSGLQQRDRVAATDSGQSFHTLGCTSVTRWEGWNSLHLTQTALERLLRGREVASPAAPGPKKKTLMT